LHIAQDYAAELRMDTADTVDHVSKENCKIQVSGIDLVPYIRNCGLPHELINERSLAASSVSAHNSDRKVNLFAEPLKQSRAFEQTAAKPWRHQFCPQEMLWQR